MRVGAKKKREEQGKWALKMLPTQRLLSVTVYWMATRALIHSYRYIICASYILYPDQFISHFTTTLNPDKEIVIALMLNIYCCYGDQVT